MRYVEIQRYGHNENQTIGELYVKEDDEIIFECKIIELPPKQNRNNISRIPSGEYPLVKMKGDMLDWSRFDYPHLWIKDVENRKGIKIHVANYFFQIEGCVAVGEQFTDINKDGFVDVTNSTKTLEKLVQLLPNQTYITIFDEHPIPDMESAGLIEEEFKSIDEKIEDFEIK
jgi:hypothetical protein